jgi:hypothetical protein
MINNCYTKWLISAEDANVVRQLFNKSFMASHCYLRAKGVPKKCLGDRQALCKMSALDAYFLKGKKTKF